MLFLTRNQQYQRSESFIITLATTQVSLYQKGKTNLDFTEARDSEWQWHPLCLMPAPQHSFFMGRMPFLPPNQQCQSTEKSC